MAPEKIGTDGEGKENGATDGREAARGSGGGWPERRRAAAAYPYASKASPRARVCLCFSVRL